MSSFKYKAIDKNGKTYEETQDAASKFALYRDLKKKGDVVIQAEEVGEGGGWFNLKKINNIFARINIREKVLFSQNLAVMIDAGLSLSRGLSILKRQTKNQKLIDVLTALEDDISGGKTLSQAMKSFPKVFSQLFTSMVKAGEESGNLAEALRTVSDQLDKSYTLRRKIRGAMIYPSIIFLVMIAIAVLMLLYIVPSLASTFESMDAQLPLTTRSIIFASEFLQSYWYIVLAAVVALGTGLWYWVFKTPNGQRAFEWFILRLPVIGFLVKEVNSARTTRTLASLLGSGVDIVVALGITRDVVQNSYYKNVIQEAQESIEGGHTVSNVFTEHENLYPIFVGEMMSVGEETGQIDKMLLSVADFYEEEVSEKTKDMSTIIEPVLMVFIGIGVGFFAVSMLQPMYSILNEI